MTQEKLSEVLEKLPEGDWQLYRITHYADFVFQCEDKGETVIPYRGLVKEDRVSTLWIILTYFQESFMTGRKIDMRSSMDNKPLIIEDLKEMGFEVEVVSEGRGRCILHLWTKSSIAHG